MAAWPVNPNRKAAGKEQGSNLRDSVWQNVGERDKRRRAQEMNAAEQNAGHETQDDGGNKRRDQQEKRGQS